MNVAGVARRARNIANALTKSTQAPFTHDAWVSHGASGQPVYASESVTRKGVIEQGPKPFRTALGEVILAKAVIYVLEPVESNGATGREEPFDPRDKITLPNGTVGAPIMGASGVVDPQTGVPYLYTVGLG